MAHEAPITIQFNLIQANASQQGVRNVCISIYFFNYIFINICLCNYQVKLARSSENCALVIVVWAPATEEGAAFSVKNDAEVAVSLIQSGSFSPPVPPPLR